jgi:hypothetical protein
MLGLQALCIASSALVSLCPSPTNRNDHYFGYASRKWNGRLASPVFVFELQEGRHASHVNSG